MPSAGLVASLVDAGWLVKGDDLLALVNMMVSSPEDCRLSIIGIGPPIDGMKPAAWDQNVIVSSSLPWMIQVTTAIDIMENQERLDSRLRNGLVLPNKKWRLNDYLIQIVTEPFGFDVKLRIQRVHRDRTRLESILSRYREDMSSLSLKRPSTKTSFDMDASWDDLRIIVRFIAPHSNHVASPMALYHFCPLQVLSIWFISIILTLGFGFRPFTRQADLEAILLLSHQLQEQIITQLVVTSKVASVWNQLLQFFVKDPANSVNKCSIVPC